MKMKIFTFFVYLTICQFAFAATDNANVQISELFEDQLNLTQDQKRQVEPILMAGIAQRISILKKYRINLDVGSGKVSVDKKLEFNESKALKKELEDLKAITHIQLSQVMSADQLATFKIIEKKNNEIYREKIKKAVGLSILPKLLLIIFISFVVFEIIWAMWKKARVYNLKETASNLSMMVINNMVKPLALAWKYFIFSLVEPMQLFSLPNTIMVLVITFVITDLIYYWYHRLSHEVPFLWAMHQTHHSSPWMNLTTAVRLNWLANFVSPLFFVPFVLLGLSAEWLTLSLTLGLFFQFFLHTELIGKLGWFEGKLLNTPSAHRVHHGANADYINKNYAGAFIIWDKMFGTYQREHEPVKFGITTGFEGHNPFVVQLVPMWKYLKRRFKKLTQSNTYSAN